ncbi:MULTISPECIES: gluconate 2-dehydrogenase subunit 3 family protein [Emticicia]|uniref:gluconate 2-dehydrogenase subunit 3 family protein n=1 Tax=Emticicia TaxID=312278 RepID=UPI0007D8A6C6|nr:MULTISPECIES: gluconate 2-dehydrogenase subunit 3 family protein [Emticicia]
MQRRTALKSLSVALGGLVSMPAWATSWTPDSIGNDKSLSASDEAILAEIVETIIPETKTPGAKSLKVHQFALRMINDCYGEAAQKSLQQGLAKTDELAKQINSKSFVECDAQQRKDTILQLSKADEASKKFVEMIKNLTIRGYTNSEYYMVNVQKYVMAPGFYHGCVPVKK